MLYVMPDLIRHPERYIIFLFEILSQAQDDI